MNLTSPPVLPAPLPMAGHADSAGALGIAQAQGLRWLLDDLLDAEPQLKDLLASPTGMPTTQRQRLAEFCGRLATALGGSVEGP